MTQRHHLHPDVCPAYPASSTTSSRRACTAPCPSRWAGCSSSRPHGNIFTRSRSASATISSYPAASAATTLPRSHSRRIAGSCCSCFYSLLDTFSRELQDPVLEPDATTSNVFLQCCDFVDVIRTMDVEWVNEQEQWLQQ